MFLCENSRNHIFMWEFWYRWLWVKYFFSNFHPKTLQIKVPSMGDKILFKFILSMDKSVIHGKKWRMTFSSVDVIHGWKVRIKMMDDGHGGSLYPYQGGGAGCAGCTFAHPMFGPLVIKCRFCAPNIWALFYVLRTQC